MKLQLLMILPLILSTVAIKVPVDKKQDESEDDTEVKTDDTQNKPIYYTSDESVDSYLIPPNPHTQEEVLPDSIVTPATYLLPPSADKQAGYYYAPTESGEQSDWYPIAQQTVPQDQPVKLLPPKLQSAAIPIFLSNANDSIPFKVIQDPRSGKVLTDRFVVPIPSVKLEPPAEDAPNVYTVQTPSEELELPAEEIDHQYDIPKLSANKGEHYLDHQQPIAPHLLPPKQFIRKYKKPTKIYPKKYEGSFKPVPIPIAQFADEALSEVPRAKPAKYFKPLPSIDGVNLTPIDEKRIYQYELAQQKQKLKAEGSQEQQDESAEKYVPVPPTEQDASESHYRYPGHNAYPVPLRPVPAAAPAPIRVAPTAAPPPQNHAQAPPAPDDRTEFRMHGMKGPHSYQFGYDTGKGKNRQFRYEERDNDGLVRGHYGYMDKHGKLRVVNYRAHPEHGFQADTQEENKE
ncbi:titin-like [Ostrinia furnacalis]|uniref:titin-like n=1 Tax=Ostrinia furnacalis TaxID=93504 RepID=UPI001040092E|nr:titin-like [Ostrinia furnacalis]